MKKYRVLFVCLGNICRSPVARGVFQQLVERDGLSEKFEIDSCGTGSWHIGHQAHENSRQTAKRNGVDIEDHRARQYVAEDLQRFDLLLAMDRSNKSDMKSISQQESEKIVLLRDYDEDKDSADVPDPYHGTGDGFQRVHDIIVRSCENLLEDLKGKISFD